MIEDDSFPLKNFGLWIILICSFILGAYIIFLSAVSIWVGVSHLHQDGAWAPILAGSLGIILTSLLSFALIKFVIKKTKEKDIIEL